MIRMKKIITFLFLNGFLLNYSFSQEVETLISEDFAIRDFIVGKDSLCFIKKRDVYLYDLKTKTSKDFFIGGYGLKIDAKIGDDLIITSSNELVDTVSSVRFYSKKKDAFEDEFYLTEGKILDFVNIPEASLFVLSMTNKKIIFIDYEERPYFYKNIEIDLNSFSRKLICVDNILYFATDNGKIFKYNYHAYTKSLLYDAKELISEFTLKGDFLFYATINGDIFKVNLKSKAFQKLKLENNFVSAMEIIDENLVCGSWSGRVYIINVNSFSIVDELDIHKRAILRIKSDNTKNIYSSSLDRTIKRWTLKK